MTIGSIAAIAILAVTSGVPALHGQSQGDICSNPALRGATVKSVLTLQSAYRDQVSITEQTTVSVPAKWPGAALLLSQSGSPWTALNCFIPVDQQEYRDSPPTITDANSEVIVTDTTAATASPSDVYFAGQDSWPMSLWAVSEDQGRLALSFDGGAVPVPVKWTVGLRVGHLAVSGEQALPTADDGTGDLTWTFVSKPSQDATESAEVALPARLAWEWRIWTWPFGVLADLANILSYGLAFYIVIVYLIRRFAKSAGGSQQMGEVVRTARRLAWVGALLYILACLNDVLISQSYNLNIQDSRIAVIAALFNVAAGAWVHSLALSGARRGRLAAWMLPGLGTLSTGTLLVGNEAGTLFPLNVLPLLIAMFLLYAGCALWTCRLWLSISRPEQPFTAGQLSKRQFRWCYVTAAALAVVDVLDPVIASSRDWAHQFLTAASTSRHDWVATSVAYNAHGYWLSADLQNALWLVVAAAFIAVLRQAAREQDVIFPGTGALEMSSIAVLLGFAFEGYWGSLAGVPVPVALVLLVLGFRYIALSTGGTPAVARGLRASTGQASGSRLLADNKVAFYDAAERIVDLDSQLTGLGGTTAPGSGNGDKARLRAEIAQLKTRIPVDITLQLTPPARRRGIGRIVRKPQPAQRAYVALPRPYDPARMLLDSGPSANWWDNGVEAVRSAAVLIVIATVFDGYLQLREGVLQPTAFPFGLTDTLFGILYVAFGWAVVAFAFGACLPYIRGVRGPVKGFVVAVIHAAALGLGDLLLYVTGEAKSPDDLLLGLVFLLFVTTLGVLIDAKTVVRYGGSAGVFGRIYRLGDARAAVTYIAAIIITTLGIWQQVATLSQETAQRAQVGQQVVQNINSMYGSGSTAP